MEHSESLPIQAPEKLVEDQAPLVRLLNGLMSEDTQWQTTRGRRDHIDVFGRPLPEGEVHYKQGHAWSGCPRLSLQSMEGVLAVVLSSHHTLNLARDAVEGRWGEMRKAAASLHSKPQD
jgi:hypothetical protein